MSASAHQKLPPRNPARACRHAALAVRRDLGGAVPHPGLRLRQRRAGRAALQGRRARLPVFALLQPDRDDVRAAHGRARGRGGRARDRDRHGGGHHRADGPGRAGDHVVASKALFGSCLYVVEDYLPRYGVASTLVDGTDLDAVAARRCGRTPRPSSWRARPIPTLEVLDIAAIAKIAHAAGATLVVDNVFATPLFQQPLELGADCVVYSATKHIDGQGRCLGGVILGSEKFIQDNIHNLIRQTGPSMSPFNAWVLLKGLETLAVRVQPADRHRGHGRGRAGRASQGHAADLSGPARPSAGRHRPPADAAAARRWSRSRSRAARPARSASRTRSSSCASATISATPRA